LRGFKNGRRRFVDEEPGRKQTNLNARRSGVAALFVEHWRVTQALKTWTQFAAQLLTQERNEAFLLHRPPVGTRVAPVLVDAIS
jgi:hypothetical protein